MKEKNADTADKAGTAKEGNRSEAPGEAQLDGIEGFVSRCFFHYGHLEEPEHYRGLEAAWAFTDPFTAYWESRQEIDFYREGSWGPVSAEKLAEEDGRTWITR